MAAIEHRYCAKNCWSTECTATYTVSPRCKHKNGWFVNVDFWIFKKEIFVCSDCGDHFDAWRMK